jgi:N-terminal domain of Peptidase_S41 in eukaryotic IRBP
MRPLLTTVMLLFCGISASAQEFVFNQQIRREVIEKALATLKTNYIFPETAQKMEAAVRERLARGEYDKISDPERFASTLEEHLTKATWEGTGVEADLAVPASDTLRAAHLKAIRSLMEQTTDQPHKTALQDVLKKLESSKSAK